MNIKEKARLFAIEAHKNTLYGKLPYEYHLEAVVGALERYGDISLEDYVFTAAYLHDVVEDTDVTLWDIRQEFGGKIARLVDAVTDGEGKNRKERKAIMYKKLAEAPPEARAIKLADRIANMEASIENPDLASMYRKEFSEFIRKCGRDHRNRELVLRCFWLYLDSCDSHY